MILLPSTKMKFHVMSLSILVALVASTSITGKDGNNLKNTTDLEDSTNLNDPTELEDASELDESSELEESEDGTELQNNTVYGYLSTIGHHLATKIREAEIRTPDEVKQRYRRAMMPSPKIINGNIARLGDIPYQAGILIDFEHGDSICGGSLLNAKRVLTAAHCWWDGQDQAYRFTVVLGSLKIYSGGIRLKTSDVIMHENWDPIKIRNDIAMVYLPKAVKFSKTIKPIALPFGKMLKKKFVGEEVVTSGYGLTQDGQLVSYDMYLSYVKMRVISNRQCHDTYKNVWPYIMCAKGVRTKNICNGDSGGPMAIVRNKKFILIGLSSFGSELSCEDGDPSGFTRISSFVGWIKNHLTNKKSKLN